MKKFLIVRKSNSQEFTNADEFVRFKKGLSFANIPFKEYEIDTNQSVGLRGIEGFRYSTVRVD